MLGRRRVADDKEAAGRPCRYEATAEAVQQQCLCQGADVIGADALQHEGDDSGLTGYSAFPNYKP